MTAISRTLATLTHRCEAHGLKVGPYQDIERFHLKYEIDPKAPTEPCGIYAVLRDTSRRYLGKDLTVALAWIDEHADEIPRATRKPAELNNAPEPLPPAELKQQATQTRRRTHATA